MKKKILPLVITGHTDHGKSTLIGRLLLETNSLPEEKIQEIKKISKEFGKDLELAYITDQLKEEREKNLTIDTAQIFFNTSRRSYCLIDTPGQAEFLKNMFTGVSFAEAAILLIDAQEGIQEQTKRHFYILNLLGIKKIIIVLNKMDLLNYSLQKFNNLKEEVLCFLKNLKVKETPPIIPISAKENENISQKSRRLGWYQGPTLLKLLDSLKEARPVLCNITVLPVQDRYNFPAQNTLVGQVISGKIKQGQKVLVLPDFKEATIIEIMVFGQKNIRKAKTGQNVGLILKPALPLKRGEVIINRAGTHLSPTTSFKGNIFWLSTRPLKINKTFTLRCLTQEVPAVAEKIERKINSATLEILGENSSELKINEVGEIIFKLEKPIVAEKFSVIKELGRFIIEYEDNPCGVGIVKEVLDL